MNNNEIQSYHYAYEDMRDYISYYYNRKASYSSINSMRFMERTRKDKERHIEKPRKSYYLVDHKLWEQKLIARCWSVSQITETMRSMKITNHRLKKSNELLRISFSSVYLLNKSVNRYHDTTEPFNITDQSKYRVYRCEIGSNEVPYCPACTSQAMFEVLRSLYDCYKRKTCDNCQCILCNKAFRDVRRSSFIKKKKTMIKLAPSVKPQPEPSGLLTPLAGKYAKQKKEILKGLAMAGLPFPKASSPSEQELMNNVRSDLGLPPEPETKELKEKYAKAADIGLMQPLEGKSPQEKERMLQKLNEMGIPLPVGRTASEKALISKITGVPYTSKSSTLAPRDKIDKEKIAPEIPEKKEVLKGPASLDIPSEPKDETIKKITESELLQPVEGKPLEEKEKILSMHGAPLPEGRTTSKKSPETQVTPEPCGASVMEPSEKLRKAKEAGLITPLEGKKRKEKVDILKGLANYGILLPEGRTDSEKKLINKVRRDIGLPPAPDTESMADKHSKAANTGFLQPLEGKTPKQKERILKGLNDIGIPLPEPRTPSEKALIAKIKAKPSTYLKLPQSEKLRRAKKAGLITPLTGKSPAQKEKILAGLANLGIPLPEGKTHSERSLVNKIRTNLGLPPEPKTLSMKANHVKAADVGLLQPLEGKTPKEKERILKGLNNMGIPLPEGRTPSETALINKIKAESGPQPILSPTEKMRKAKATGLLTPLEGKSPDKKEQILKGLAMLGIPLPEHKTGSERSLMNKVRADLGLPPEPEDEAMKNKYAKAADAGLLLPLEGKSPKEKEKILKGLHAMNIPLPIGRTPSEKSLINKIIAKPHPSFPILSPSEKIRRAKVAGLVTPLKGKTPEQKENILKGLAHLGIPLPEGQTQSEKDLINNVRNNLGLPPEPKTPVMRDKHAIAADAGLLQPLEGKKPEEKERILQGLKDIGIPLPEGRTPSEKNLIAQIKAKHRAPSILAPSEKLRRAKATGLITPLKGKTPEQKEKILQGLANLGIPLPEGKTESEKNIIDKVRADFGLPPEPKTSAMKEKHLKAADNGLLLPLEGQSPKEKERILRGLKDIGIPLPEGRTSSEKALITNIKAGSQAPSLLAPSEKMRKAKAAGLLTPLKGKTPEQMENILTGLAKLGIPLPEGKTESEKNIIKKVRNNLGLPPEPKTKAMKDKHLKAADAGLLQPLEGKPLKEKERILQGLYDNGIPLPQARTPSEKAIIAKIKSETHASTILSPSEKIRRAKAAGLFTPLEGKPPAKKEKILKDLATQGILLPKATTASEKNIINKVRTDLGLPPEPKTDAMRDKHAKAADAGILLPLEGKSNKQKENILRGLNTIGIPLPEGRTPSEKALINKIKTEPYTPSTLAPSEKMRRAKVAGLITPLNGKTPEQKEKILRGLASLGILLPEGKTDSEKKIIKKVRTNLGLPPEPKNSLMRDKHTKAADAGLLQPLEGKPAKEKERILRGLHDIGIPLPEGRTPSEKALIARIKADPRGSTKKTPSGQIRESKTATHLIPSRGTKPTDKETEPPSSLSKHVPSIFGSSERKRTAKAAGLLTPLKGKSPEQKAAILKGLAMHGIPFPEGTTPSENNLINKIRTDIGLPPEPVSSNMKQKHLKAADAGLLQPLEGRSPKEQERIIRGLAEMGIPLPEGRTPSEKALIEKIKTPPTITYEKLHKAKKAGLLTPLSGKSPKEKQKILKNLAKVGLPLPEGKTPSDKELINQIKKDDSILERTHKDRIRKAQADGFLTPLEGKTPEEKEKILRGRVAAGLPLPVGKTISEKDLINKIKASTGYSTPSPTDIQKRAKAAGLITPIKGKTPSRKIKILKDMAAAGVPLPEGETPSDKALIKKMTPKKTKSQKIKQAKAAGILTPLAGKTRKQKEKILRGLVDSGLPLPEGETPSEKDLIKQIRAEAGLPPEPDSPSIKEKYRKAEDEGLITPLEGKLPAEKAEILRKLADAEVPLPEGRTPSEKSMIKKIKTRSKKVRVSEEIPKSVCNQACGCDRKKIKFKHSYVKITVLSPDISSLCSCPDECLPRIESGVKVDNEGIKVTIASVISIPNTISTERTNITQNGQKQVANNKTQLNNDHRNLSYDTIQIIFDKMDRKDRLDNRINSFSSFETYPSGDTLNYSKSTGTSPVYISFPNKNHNCDYPSRFDGEDVFNSRYIESTSDIQKVPVSCFSSSYLGDRSSESSLTSIFIIKSCTTLSMNTSAASFYSGSTISYTDGTASIYTQYSDPVCYEVLSGTSMDYASTVTTDYCTEYTTESDSIPFIRRLASIRRIGDNFNNYLRMAQCNIICFCMSQTRVNRTHSNKTTKSSGSSMINIR